MKLINYFNTFYFILTGILLILMIFLMFLYAWRSPTHRRRCRLLPKPKFKPIVGMAIDLLRLKDTEVLDYFGSLINKLGLIVYIEVFGVPTVLLNDPEDVEQILSSSQHITKGVEYISLLPWLCEGLLTSSGAKWHMRRKILTPTFHFKILENYVSILNRNAHLLTKKFLQTSGDSCVDVLSYVSLCTLDIICETTMGTRLNAQIGYAEDYVAAIQRALEIIFQRTFNFLIYNDLIFYSLPIGREFTKIVKNLHAFTDKVIKERKEMHKNFAQNTATESGRYKNRKSFLDHLIEMQKQNLHIMSDADIREEVDTFMFEGHETTSVAIMWALYLLAKNPNIKEKVQEEIWSIFGESDRDATLEALHELRYLDMVIKECLRLCPSVPYISRHMNTDLKLKNYTIPANTNIGIVPYLMHRNPEYFPDPEKFDPDRFLPEVSEKRHPFAYIPFSAGFRNCIGQKFAMLELKIVISTILRKLDVKEGPIKQKLKVMPHVTLRSNPKIFLSFSPLQKSN